MTIFDYIYNFYKNLFYVSDNYFLDDLMFSITEDFSIGFLDWWAISLTIVTVILLAIFLILFTKWLFKLAGGLFKW